MSFQSDMASDIDNILGLAEGSVDFEYKLQASASEWSDAHGWISANKSDYGQKMDAEGVSSDLVISIPSIGSYAISGVVEDETVIKFDGKIYVVVSIDQSHMSGLDILNCKRFSETRKTGMSTKKRRYV